jgi:arabinose-5-phosphate isomerase
VSTPARGAASTQDGCVVAARRVLEIEAAAVRALADRIGVDFARAVEVLAACAGRVVVTGIGKSGLVARKIAATFASTGTPALFLHAAEGLHGDIGMLARGDCVLVLSNSGATVEVIALLGPARRLGLPVIAMTGAPESTLGRASDVVLDVSVAEEACPLGLAPTASTTAALAMGDALAIALLERRGFRSEDFSDLHPAGALGRRLRRVDELMHVGGEMPVVSADAPVREAIDEMSRKRLGLTGVVEADGRLVGIITDGDLRRAIQARGDLRSLHARDLMTRAPKTVAPTALAEHAVALMEEHSITALFIADDDGRPAGVLHMHDLLRASVI